MAYTIKEVLANYYEAEDLINIGAYVEGSNPKIDYAMALFPKVLQHLKQGMFQKSSFEQSVNLLYSLKK